MTIRGISVVQVISEFLKLAVFSGMSYLLFAFCVILSGGYSG